MSVVTASNAISINFNQAFAYGVGQTSTAQIPLSFRSLFKVFGDLLDQCDLIHCKTYTFVASTPQVIDLKALLDILGAAVVFAKVRFFAIRVNSQTDGQVLLVGANGSNDWLGLSSTGSTVTVYPSTANNDGFAIWQMPNSAGAAVGSSTHLLKLDPGGNAFTVDLMIAGCVNP
jgi:hypothetical protein